MHSQERRCTELEREQAPGLGKGEAVTKGKRGNLRGRVAGVNAALDGIVTRKEALEMPLRVNKMGAAKLLGRHPETIVRLARKGQIPGARYESGTWMFSTKILLDYVDGLI